MVTVGEHIPHAVLSLEPLAFAASVVKLAPGTADLLLTFRPCARSWLPWAPLHSTTCCQPGVGCGGKVVQPIRMEASRHEIGDARPNREPLPLRTHHKTVLSPCRFDGARGRYGSVEGNGCTCYRFPHNQTHCTGLQVTSEVVVFREVYLPQLFDLHIWQIAERKHVKSHLWNTEPSLHVGGPVYCRHRGRKGSRGDVLHPAVQKVPCLCLKGPVWLQPLNYILVDSSQNHWGTFGLVSVKPTAEPSARLLCSLSVEY
mmetsp:Transcript_76697/g.148141  ORF Transcript_76697/g.148141 Transcript_76697/m.148141 type:complete len:258 (-) Transcript_76697:656-1429(-)|eukprot:CAMPEP_0172788880 /NCGR_PEP_ID=MMETSP1074-20121228/207177_1 /TAXON_ID=2916 /ORGANISM="Ceratium fusus, Strain PA161109" /LENGTH=257 /DNA_ID=CAMNT_0013625913 /DNA_START=389 /DNA_END=1162 /DNA_ORIENTATION=-